MAARYILSRPRVASSYSYITASMIIAEDYTATSFTVTYIISAVTDVHRVVACSDEPQ